MPLEVSYKLAQRGSCMTLVFSLKNKFFGPPVDEIGEGKFSIDGLVDIRLQFHQKASCEAENDDLPVFVNISTKKTEKGKHLKVKLRTTYANVGLSKQIVCADEWSDWVLLGTDNFMCEEPNYILKDLQIDFAVSKYGAVTFAELYYDTEITDFNLTLDDAVVPVHKACLVAHSSEFKTMFRSSWKDKSDGRIEVKGVTKRTLPYLKDYMYLGKLPDGDIRPMLLFAIHFSMPNLKADCITKLVETVEFYSLYNLLEFACENNIPELAFALMVQTSDHIVHNAYVMMKNPPKADTHIDFENLKLK